MFKSFVLTEKYGLSLIPTWQATVGVFSGYCVYIPSWQIKFDGGWKQRLEWIKSCGIII